MESKEEKEAREESALKEHARMHKLFKENRFMFELEVRKQVEEAITSAPPDMQPRLREIQAKWQNTMKGAGSKHNRLVLAEHMLMEHFTFIFSPALNWASVELKRLFGEEGPTEH